MKVRFLDSPKVYRISTSSVYEASLRVFMEENDAMLPRMLKEAKYDGEKLPEIAGRLCYMSFKSAAEGKGRPTNEEYIKHILEVGHESVLEHATMGFIITGVSRSLTHELVRHRAGMSYSQLSQRYVSYKDSIDIVIPPEFLTDTEARGKWEKKVINQIETYEESVSILEQMDFGDASKTDKKKRLQQAARSLLPNCVETKIMVTGNMRSWRHFIELRGSLFADLEIQRLAIHLFDYYFSRYACFMDFEKKEENGRGFLVKNKLGGEGC